MEDLTGSIPVGRSETNACDEFIVVRFYTLPSGSGPIGGALIATLVVSIWRGEPGITAVCKTV